MCLLKHTQQVYLASGNPSEHELELQGLELLAWEEANKRLNLLCLSWSLHFFLVL